MIYAVNTIFKEKWLIGDHFLSCAIQNERAPFAAMCFATKVKCWACIFFVDSQMIKLINKFGDIHKEARDEE